MFIAWPLLCVALSSSVGNLVVLGLVRYLRWNMGFQLGRRQPRAGLAGKRETRVETHPPPCHAAVETPAMSRKSSVVSWSGSPREQSEANGEDAVMEDCTETHQAEFNKKIKANDKL